MVRNFSKRNQTGAPAGGSGRSDCLVVPGRRAVEYGLLNHGDRCVEIVWANEGLKSKFDAPRGITQKIVTEEALDDLAGYGVAHGGVIARFRRRDVVFRAEELAAKLDDKHPCGMALDGVTDPRNLGAILRSALWFGIPWVIVPERHAAPLTGAAAKTSAGAILSVDVVRVTNLARAMDELRKHGVWIYAADGGAGSSPMDQAPVNHPCVLIVGDEGRGVRPNVKKRADVCLSIPGRHHPGFDSLNVSVASAILAQHIVHGGE